MLTDDLTISTNTCRPFAAMTLSQFCGVYSEHGLYVVSA